MFSLFRWAQISLPSTSAPAKEVLLRSLTVLISRLAEVGARVAVNPSRLPLTAAPPQSPQIAEDEAQVLRELLVKRILGDSSQGVKVRRCSLSYISRCRGVLVPSPGLTAGAPLPPPTGSLRLRLLLPSAPLPVQPPRSPAPRWRLPSLASPRRPPPSAPPLRPRPRPHPPQTSSRLQRPGRRRPTP
jgi:hypothetical protein